MATVNQAYQKANENFDNLTGKRSGKSGFWEHVDELLAFLYEMWPLELIDLEMEAKRERETSYNKFHSNKDLSQRIIGSPPFRLVVLLDKIYGKDLPYKDYNTMWREFFKRYPQFSYAEKI